MKRTILVAALALGLAACGPKPEEAKAADPGSTAAEALQKQNLDAVSALGAAAGGSTNPQMKAFTTSLNKVADAILTIKDEASAKAVGEQLKPVYAEMELQAKAVDALPESEKAAASMAAVSEIMGPAMKISQHMMAMSPELRAIVEKELDNMPKPPQ